MHTVLADQRRPKLKEVEADLKEAEQIVGPSPTLMGSGTASVQEGVF